MVHDYSLHCDVLVALVALPEGWLDGILTARRVLSVMNTVEPAYERFDSDEVRGGLRPGV